MTGADQEGLLFADWVRQRVAAESYWFHRMELPGGILTPGWSDPGVDKLPYFGLPEDMRGMRVLDIGAAEGFFSFEAERRGAAEVIAIENYPPMIRKFHLCAAALGSRAASYCMSVYDLDRRTLGSFDLIFFFGVLYHLRHPLLALERIREVCSGTLLMQTATGAGGSPQAAADFYPFGIESGPPGARQCDPTCFWFPNASACEAMLAHVGFTQVERPPAEVSVGAVLRARSPVQAPGAPPDERTAPWA